MLKQNDARINCHDFYIPKLQKTRKYNYEMESVRIDTINKYDLVILATDHDDYDYDVIFREAKLIIDTLRRFNVDNDKVI